MFYLLSILEHLRRRRRPVQAGTRGALATPRRLRLVGAALLLSGLLLPLYSCRGTFVDRSGREVSHVDAQGRPIPAAGMHPRQALAPGVERLEPGSRLPAGVVYRKRYHYFFSDFEAGEPSDWVRLAGFLWPLPAALWTDGLRRRWAVWLFRLSEPLLLLVSALSLCVGAMFGTQEAGFWTAWTGIVLYGAGAVWADGRALAASALRWRRPLMGLAVLAFLASALVSVLLFFDGFRR